MRFLALSLLLVLSSAPSSAALPPELDAWLVRIFQEGDLDPLTFGPARWLDGGDAYTTLEPSAALEGARDLVRYETESGERSILVPATRLLPEGREEALEIDDYEWSADRTKLLVFTNTRKVWRDDTRGDYWLLDLDSESGTLRRLGGDGPESSMLFAHLSPDAARVGFVRANDLWVEDLASGEITRLTSDGSETTINGTSDWVYEEELGVRDAWRWSPDGARIAYWSFDSTGVGIFRLIDDTSTLYPKITEIPYPKVGTTNSAVRIGVVAASGGETTWMQVPGDPREHYVARMDWSDDDALVLQRLNRLQNTNDVLFADAGSGRVRRHFRDQSDAWLDVVDEHQWMVEGPGRSLLWLSERDGWRRAYRIDGGGAAHPITPPGADVVRTLGADPQGRFLDYLASPDDPTRLGLYRAPVDASSPPRRLTPGAEGWHVYDVSPDHAWAFHTTSSFDRPPRVELVSLPDHRVVRELVSSEELTAEIAPLLAARSEFLRVGVEDGVQLDGWMIRPADFDASRTYPLLVFVYGEPWSQTVTDRWSGRRSLFHRALANTGWVIASFDNRGTPAPRGAKWRKSVYGAIGELSAQDQDTAVRALLARSPFLDPERVAIWGWSGGGSNTLNAMFRYPETFAVGVSVAPVPDQTLYDTIYQERYMGLPEENQDGYRRGSPIHHAEGLAGRLLLVHGSGDDNVHYQGTERLVNRLIELGKDFDLMVYPNRSHSISEGEGTSLHVYRLIARYLIENVGR